MIFCQLESCATTRWPPPPPAGTRYRKRGVSDAGHVANEVETEQILDAGAPAGPGPLRYAAEGGGGRGSARDMPVPRLSSCVQVRWGESAGGLA